MHNKKPVLYSPEAKLQTKRKLEETKPTLPQPPVKKLNIGPAIKTYAGPKTAAYSKLNVVSENNKICADPIPNFLPKPRTHLVGCNVCGKFGENLFDCMGCFEKFHAHHHVKIVNFEKVREKLCPQCLRRAIKEKCVEKKVKLQKPQATSTAKKTEIEFVNC